MSALADVQKSLNAIRRISADTDFQAQHKILELILQTSISHLKALSGAAKPTILRKQKMPPPLPIPKATSTTAPQQSRTADTKATVPSPDALKPIKPQAPLS